MAALKNRSLNTVPNVWRVVPVKVNDLLFSRVLGAKVCNLQQILLVGLRSNNVNHGMEGSIGVLIQVIIHKIAHN